MFDKAKQHFRNNKKTYLACGVTAVVVGGITYYFMKNGKCIEIVGDPEIALPVSQAANIVGAHNTVNQTVINLIERSCPSKPVGLLSEDGESIKQAFNSISEAARALSLDQGAVSKVVSGRSAHVKGHVFKELDLAS